MRDYVVTSIVKTETREIGPEEAKSILLNKNKDNRPFSLNKAREYATFMERGHWRVTGDPIQISTDGVLLNGQHRLAAVVASGKPATFLIVTLGSEKNGQLTALGIPLDRGKSRSIADVTGVDKKGVEVIRTLIRDLAPDGQRLAQDPIIIARVYEDLREACEYVNQKCSTAARGFSRASIRGMIVLRHAEGRDFTEEYRNILNQHYELLTHSWISWYRRVRDIPHNDNIARHRIMALTWAVTQPDREPEKSLVVRDDEPLLSEARATLLDLSPSAWGRKPE